jgi:hypothetical protein
MDDRRVTDAELAVYAELLAAFFRRRGRDPSQAETNDLVAVARHAVAAGATALH